MKSKKCTILGLGWLGLPVANHLIEKGFKVNGTTTSIEKSERINSTTKIEAFVWNLEHSPSEELLAKTSKSNVVIVAIPASKVFKNLDNLILFLSALPQKIELVFCSSTGVYPDDLVTSSETYQFTEKDFSNSNVQMEVRLQKELQQRLTILRLAGLIGANRHPVTMLSGRENIPDGDAPVNLVQLKDVVLFIDALFEKKFFGEIVNVCYPIHPTRSEYYTSCADHLGLPVPHFLEGTTKLKIVSSEKSIVELGFHYLHTITLHPINSALN